MLGPDFAGDHSKALSTVRLNPNTVRAYVLHGSRSYLAHDTGRQRASLDGLPIKADARDLEASANFGSEAM